MEIKRLGNSRLSIRISEPELTALGFSCEMVDCASQATQAMVLALLEIAEKEVGFQPEDCLVVRLETLEDGGCLLLLASPQMEGAAPCRITGNLRLFRCGCPDRRIGEAISTICPQDTKKYALPDQRGMEACRLPPRHTRKPFARGSG